MDTTGTNKKIQVLLVDDSVMIRKIIKSLFKEDTDIEIADEAINGLDAISKLKEKDFDVVLLDFEMPEMNGLEFLTALKKESSINKKPPVIVFSSLSDAGSKVTIQCLLAGAKDYLLKPSSTLGEESTGKEIKERIKEKIKSIVKTKSANPSHKVSNTKPQKLDELKLRYIDLVLIGASTGGPNALEIVLKAIPKNFPVPVLIVQHMPPGFTKMLATSLHERCNIPVLEVTENTKVEAGKIFIAGGGKHMIYESGNLIHKEGELVNFCMPSVDVLFQSVAKVFKGKILSIMLTGMGKDGAEGVKSLKKNLDCYSIIQDEASSVVWSMPKAVYEAGCSDAILPLEQIGGCLTNVRKHS
jgi:two-component system, chemotaxis family, protein-glutamate methylesterase/glutaminase